MKKDSSIDAYPGHLSNCEEDDPERSGVHTLQEVEDWKKQLNKK